MPYVAPSTVVAGQTYSASAHNVIVNDVIDHEARINQYAGVYTNEAARDAAITSPTEGMRVYLTAPTVPAATSGGYTAVPTGIQTIYNGSVWVCVTEIGAGRIGPTGCNSTSTSYATTLTSDSTAISVTLVTGTTANVSFGVSAYGSTSVVPSATISVSGATTLAASDNYGIVADQPSAQQMSVATNYVLTGLTAGTNTFTLNYRSSTGSAVTFVRRHLVVKGVA